MKNKLIGIGLLCVVIMQLAGCSLWKDTSRKVSEEQQAAKYAAAREACVEAFSTDDAKPQIRAVSYYDSDRKYIKVCLSMPRKSPQDVYYCVADGSISACDNYSTVEKELSQLFCSRTGLPMPTYGSLSLSSMSTGKRVIYYGDTCINDVIRDARPYYLTGRLAYRSDIAFDENTMDKLYKIFGYVDIEIYLYDVVPQDQKSIFAGEPTIRYLHQNTYGSTEKQGTDVENVVSEEVTGSDE